MLMLARCAMLWHGSGQELRQDLADDESLKQLEVWAAEKRPHLAPCSVHRQCACVAMGSENSTSYRGHAATKRATSQHAGTVCNRRALHPRYPFPGVHAQTLRNVMCREPPCLLLAIRGHARGCPGEISCRMSIIGVVHGLLDVPPNLARHRPTLARFGPKLARNRPKLAGARQIMARHRRDSTRFRPESIEGPG